MTPTITSSAAALPPVLVPQRVVKAGGAHLVDVLFGERAHYRMAVLVQERLELVLVALLVKRERHDRRVLAEELVLDGTLEVLPLVKLSVLGVDLLKLLYDAVDLIVDVVPDDHVGDAIQFCDLFGAELGLPRPFLLEMTGLELGQMQPFVLHAGAGIVCQVRHEHIELACGLALEVEIDHLLDDELDGAEDVFLQLLHVFGRSVLRTGALEMDDLSRQQLLYHLVALGLGVVPIHLAIRIANLVHGHAVSLHAAVPQEHVVLVDADERPVVHLVLGTVNRLRLAILRIDDRIRQEELVLEKVEPTVGQHEHLERWSILELGLELFAFKPRKPKFLVDGVKLLPVDVQFVL